MIAPYDDTELLAQLRAGSKEAFTELYHRYSEKLYHAVISWMKDEEITEEIVQDVFCVIWQKRETIEIQSNFIGYLVRTAKNKMIDLFREVKRRDKLYSRIAEIASGNYISDEDIIRQTEDTRLLDEAINALPAKRSIVYRLCRLEGKSYEEISKIMGVSLSTIKDHMEKATKSIREYILKTKKTAILVILFQHYLHTILLAFKLF